MLTIANHSKFTAVAGKGLAARNQRMAWLPMGAETPPVHKGFEPASLPARTDEIRAAGDMGFSECSAPTARHHTSLGRSARRTFIEG
jgi:hypothetical protein